MQQITINPIGNRKELIKTNSQLVDTLLEEHSKLIDPAYKKWYAKNFYHLTEIKIRRCASEAMADGKDPVRLFCYLIKKEIAQAIGGVHVAQAENRIPQK